MGPTALKDLASLPQWAADQVLRRLALLENNLYGNIKKLHGDEVRYRLRCGDYRVLFKLDGNEILVQRVKNRKDAYGDD